MRRLALSLILPIAFAGAGAVLEANSAGTVGGCESAAIVVSPLPSPIESGSAEVSARWRAA